jgi:hypothetical protein
MRNFVQVITAVSPTVLNQMSENFVIILFNMKQNFCHTKIFLMWILFFNKKITAAIKNKFKKKTVHKKYNFKTLRDVSISICQKLQNIISFSCVELHLDSSIFTKNMCTHVDMCKNDCSFKWTRTILAW